MMIHKHKHTTILSLLSLTAVWFAPIPANAQFSRVEEEPVPLSDLQRFTTVIEHIKNYYVSETEDQLLFENAIRGMLAGLDPHSSYLDIDDFSDLKVSTSGKFGGLGIEVTMEDGFVRVISPIDDTPASKAGIEAGDLIIRLNDTPVKGLSLKEAVDIMRGKKGSTLVLTILRQGDSKPFRLKITRDIINVQSVKSKIIENEFGYIRVSQFQNDTGDELIDAVKKLQKEVKGHLKGLVLDLRNNPGGILDASVDISNAFLDADKLDNDALIVYTKGRLPNSQISEKARSGDLLQGAPIVVLVNQGSASASEIVAGALQDHRRAIILGTQTFGKGTVQTILPLKDKRGLKLTTALYYTPKGRSIQAEGIQPDIIVENIKVPKASNEDDNSLSLREEDLQRHLSNQGTLSKTESNTESNDAATSLASEDYQLHEAINLLKGLSLIST